MPINSLRQVTGAASTAFATARTTFKAMADAAVPPAGSDAAASGERHSGEPVAPVKPAGRVTREAERTPADKRKAGVRKGTSLDAYA
jgi:hypothetical protein